MRCGSFVLALTSLFLSGASLAAEPSFCSSVCDSERRACRADLQERAAEDGNKGLLNIPERNQLARTAAKTQSPSSAEQAGTHAGVQTRRLSRIGACDDTYQRCTRECKTPAAAVTVRKG